MVHVLGVLDGNDIVSTTFMAFECMSLDVITDSTGNVFAFVVTSDESFMVFADTLAFVVTLDESFVDSNDILDFVMTSDESFVDSNDILDFVMTSDESFEVLTDYVIVFAVDNNDITGEDVLAWKGNLPDGTYFPVHISPFSWTVSIDNVAVVTRVKWTTIIWYSSRP